MIDFELGDELALIRETALGFANDHLRPRDREFEKARAVAAEVHEAFRAIGFGAIEVPEAQGRAGLGARGDHRIEKLFRDVKAMDIVEGTGEIQRLIMARRLVNLSSERGWQDRQRTGCRERGRDRDPRRSLREWLGPSGTGCNEKGSTEKQKSLSIAAANGPSRGLPSRRG